MKAILFLAIQLVSTSIFAQTEITGSVTDKKNNPLIGARVMITGTYDGGVVNPSGKFSFTTKQKDSVAIQVQFMGFETQTKLVLLLSGVNEFNFILKEKFNELDAVTITAGAFEAGDKKKANLLSSLDMVTTPGAAGNVVNALQFLPGTSKNGESGKLFVRGGSSNESKTYIDGTLVHNPFNASAPNTSVRSRFNPFMFSGTVFSTGGFSAEYGEALSSVLLLETKGIQEEDQLDISILSVGLGLAGTKKWKKSTLTASIDYSNLTPYMKLVPQAIQWDKMPETLEAGISYRFKTKHGLLKVYGNYSESKFNMYQPHISDADSDFLKLSNRNLYVNSSYKTTVGDNWILNLQSGFTDYTEHIFINDNHVEEQTIGGHAKVKAVRSFSKKLKFIVGSEVLTKDFEQVYTSANSTITNQFNNFHLGSFIEVNWYVSKKLVIRAGTRLDHSILLKETKVSPRTSIAYQLNKNSQVSFAHGLFYQTPDNDFLLYTDKLKFEQTNQYMLNYSFSKKRRSFKAEAYYKPYNNLVKFNSDKAFYQSEFYTNEGTGSAYGIDLFFRDKKTIKNGDYWISYSYLDAKRNYLNFPTEAQPRFASKHNISVVYKHWLPKCRTLLGASFNYSSPRVFNDPNEADFNSQKMKAYQALNLNASFLYRENVIFYASATNVLGYKNEFGYRFASTPDSDGVYAKQLITPPADRFFVLGCFITLSKKGDKNQLDKIN
ncbi:MAG: carboxypeptidase-like regulatory domain-containing protein [Crocinitomicaceae bacterium]